MPAANVDQALISRLRNDTGVQAVVGSQPTPAVFMGRLPENAIENNRWPAVTFWSITDQDPAVSHDGSSGLLRTRYQFTCWGSTMTDANAVARAVKACLHVFEGIVDGYRLGPCFLISSVSTFDQAQNVYLVHVDFTVWNQG